MDKDTEKMLEILTKNKKKMQQEEVDKLAKIKEKKLSRWINIGCLFSFITGILLLMFVFD